MHCPVILRQHLLQLLLEAALVVKLSGILADGIGIPEQQLMATQLRDSPRPDRSTCCNHEKDSCTRVIVCGYLTSASSALACAKKRMLL